MAAFTPLSYIVNLSKCMLNSVILHIFLHHINNFAFNELVYILYLKNHSFIVFKNISIIAHINLFIIMLWTYFPENLATP